MQGENQNTEKSRITERVRSWEKYGGWTNLKPKGIQTTLMGVFSLVSITIMLISGFVMYIWFSTLSREETVQSTQKLMEQTGESLEDYLVSMRQVSDTVYYNIIKESDFSKQKQEIQSRMNLLYEANKDNLRSIAIYNHIQCCGDLFLQSAQPGYGRGYDYADRDQYGTYNFQHRNDTAALPGIRLDHQTGKKTPERGRRSSR